MPEDTFKATSEDMPRLTGLLLTISAINEVPVSWMGPVVTIWTQAWAAPQVMPDASPEAMSFFESTRKNAENALDAIGIDQELREALSGVLIFEGSKVLTARKAAAEAIAKTSSQG